MFQFGMCVCGGGGGGGCYTSKTKAQYYEHIAGKVFIVNRQIPCVPSCGLLLAYTDSDSQREQDLGFLLRYMRLK